MSRIVYTSSPQFQLSRLILPHLIVKDLWKHRELLIAITKRDFQSIHRGTYLGLAWTVLSPLLMLAVFTLVFGYIFKGRFTTEGTESPVQYALALFAGLNFFNCVSQTLGASPTLIFANGVYVKTVAFPTEIIPVSAVLNVLINLAIGLSLCLAGFVAINGYIHISALSLIPITACVTLICLGLSWFLSSLGVFVRDIPAIVPPISLILLFMSAVIFPLAMVPSSIRWIVLLNPLAILIDSARTSLMYGQWPNFALIGLIFVLSLAFAIAGYWFFCRSKNAFADVM